MYNTLEKQRIWAKTYRESHKSQIRIKRVEKQKELSKWVDSIKLSRGCKDCGYSKYAVALEFDHLRDKVNGIAQLVRLRASRSLILSEIEKCEVVCANCHAFRTKERRQHTTTQICRVVQ